MIARRKFHSPLQTDSIIPAAAELSKLLLGRRHLRPDLNLPTPQISANQMPRIEGDDCLSIFSFNLQGDDLFGGFLLLRRSLAHGIHVERDLGEVFGLFENLPAIFIGLWT